MSKGPQKLLVETVEVLLPRPRTEGSERTPLHFELIARIRALISGYARDKLRA